MREIKKDDACAPPLKFILVYLAFVKQRLTTR